MAYLVGQTDKAYISSISFLDERQKLNKLLDIYDEGSNILDIMEMTGRMIPVSGPEFETWANEWLFTAAVVDTGGVDGTKDGTRLSDGTNKNALLTITSDAALPVVGELAMFPSGSIGIVTEVTSGTPSFEVAPLSQDAGDELSPAADVIAADDSVIFFSGSYGEGTGSPEGRKPKFRRSQNYLQNFKEANAVTDLQKASEIEIEYKGKKFVMYKLQHDTLLRHRSKIAYGLLAGKKAKTTDGDGNAVYTTQGLLQYIQNGDGSVNTTTGITEALGGGTIAKSNLRTISRKLDKIGAPKEYWAWFGGDLMADTEDVFHGLDNIKNGGIVYNSFGAGTGKNKAIDLGLNSVHLHGRTFHFKTLDAFDHPGVFGADGFAFGGSGFMIPGNKIKPEGGGEAMDRIRVRYLSGDGTDLKYIENVTGKLAPRSTNDISEIRFSYQSWMGLEVLGNEHFVYISK